MHWCVNINALQRPFSSDFLWSWLLPSPEESVSSVKYNFLLLRPEISGHPCCVVADSNTGRKEDVEREWIEYDFTFQLPLALSHTQGILFLRYCILYPVTIYFTCAIKPLFVSYLHATGREKLKIWSGPSFKPFPKANWPGTRGWGLGSPLDFSWRMLCSATKANRNLLRRRKGQRGLRFDCSWDHLHRLLPTDKLPHIHIFLAFAWLMERSACVCKRKHTFKENCTDIYMLKHVLARTHARTHNPIKSTYRTFSSTSCFGI